LFNHEPNVIDSLDQQLNDYNNNYHVNNNYVDNNINLDYGQQPIGNYTNPSNQLFGSQRSLQPPPGQQVSFNLASQRQQPVYIIEPYGNNTSINTNNSQIFQPQPQQQQQQQQQYQQVQSPFQPVFPIQSIQPGIIVLPPPQNLQFLPAQQQQQFYPIQTAPAQFYPTPAPLTHLNQQQYVQAPPQQDNNNNNMPYNNNNNNNNNSNYNNGYNNNQYDQDEQNNQYDDGDDQNQYDEQEQHDEENEDMKQQQIWNRLQKSREESVKKKGKSTGRNNGGLPPTVPKRQAPPKIEQERVNFLEKNIESIRNKENLSHRYPEKKYETLYGKFYKHRAKSE
jgi:hypothetical protein